MARKVAEQITPINRSVFFYGWARGLTTVSSNRAVAKLIEATVSREGDVAGVGVAGPEIWLCATARSLVGKERSRRA